MQTQANCNSCEAFDSTKTNPKLLQAQRYCVSNKTSSSMYIDGRTLVYIYIYIYMYTYYMYIERERNQRRRSSSSSAPSPPPSSASSIHSRSVHRALQSVPRVFPERLRAPPERPRASPECPWHIPVSGPCWGHVGIRLGVIFGPQKTSLTWGLAFRSGGPRWPPFLESRTAGRSQGTTRHGQDYGT